MFETLTASLGIVLKLSTPYGEFGSSTFPNSDARSELGSVWVLGSKLGQFIQCMRRGGHLRLLHWIESFWFASLIFQHSHGFYPNFCRSGGSLSTTRPGLVAGASQ